MTVAHDISAVKLGRAEHDNPVIAHRIVLQGLIYDEGGEGRGAEHGQ
jgi:hypothetical protein